MNTQDWHTIILVLHFIGLLLGAGGATITDIIFVTTVRKRHANHTLQTIMEVTSSVVLIGYLILLFSGVGLITTGSHPSDRFWAKMVMVGIVGMNGFFAHVVTFPRLSRAMTSRSTDVTTNFVHQLSVTGGISIVSWYGAIIAGTWKSSTWSFGLWVGVYSAILFLAILGSFAITPILLRLDHPDYFDVFPTRVINSARKAQLMRDRKYRERPNRVATN